MSDFLCIYHHPCADGFGSAWAVRQALGDIEFHEGIHQNPPPDVSGKHVIMVDFSYKRPVIEQMMEDAASILILDHHKSAAEDLDGFPPPIAGSWESHWDEVSGAATDGRYDPKLPRVVFDMERSGAGIAWDFFHGGEPRPGLIDHIEDRDLWRFRLDGTREIQAAVFSYPYDFDVWDELMERSLGDLWREGCAIERKHHKDVSELVGVMKRRMVIGGHDVPVANIPYTLTSDAGLLMAEGEPFAACYWDTPDGRVFSLRSQDSGLDVSSVAVAYGGGGHKNASGFRMPIGWEGDE